MVTFYGAQSVAREMIAGVNNKHASVRGQTDQGVAYTALDQDLLTWVQATAAFGFVAAFDAYARPLADGDWNNVLSESRPIAEAYGVQEPPLTKAAVMSLLRSWEPRLEPSETLDTFLRMMRKQPTLPWPGQLLQPLFVRAAISLVPARTREQLQLTSQRLRLGEAAIVKGLVRGSRLLRLRNHPASLARQRTHKKTAEA